MKCLSVCILAWMMIFVASPDGWCQESPAPADPVEPPPPVVVEIYLRVANLMPLGQQRAEVLRGDSPMLGELKPGFVMPYIALAKEDPWTFQVRWGGSTIGSFKIDPAKAPGFYTAVIMPDGNRAKLEFSEDMVEPPKESEFAFPARRLRAFLPALGFEYTVAAGELGTWSIHSQSKLVDLPLAGTAPKEVKVSFTSRDGDKVDLFFPTDFTAHPRQAVFVSQRGIQRPRIRVYPDNVPPTEEAGNATVEP